MSKIDMIELIAAVLLRITAFVYAVSAVRNAYHLFLHIQHVNSSTLAQLANADGYYTKMYSFDTAYDAIAFALMFLLSAPLAQLLTRGLASRLAASSQAI